MGGQYSCVQEDLFCVALQPRVGKGRGTVHLPLHFCITVLPGRWSISRTKHHWHVQTLHPFASMLYSLTPPCPCRCCCLLRAVECVGTCEIPLDALWAGAMGDVLSRDYLVNPSEQQQPGADESVGVVRLTVVACRAFTALKEALRREGAI